MSKSHGHQQAALLTALVERAQARKPGLSKQAMVLSLGFDDEAQLNHAIASLVENGAISIDIDGRFPSFRIWRTKRRAAMPLRQPLFLSAGGPALKPGEAPGWKQAAQAVKSAESSPPPAEPTVDILPAEQEASTISAVEAALKLEPKVPGGNAVQRSNQISFKLTPADIDWLNQRYLEEGDAESFSAFCRGIFVLEMNRMREPAPPPIPNSITIRLAKQDYEYLVEDMEQSGLSISLAGYCAQLVMAEIDRRAGPEGAKHKISATVIRAAREEGRDLGEFVTSMIAVGMAAREMNRKGL